MPRHISIKARDGILTLACEGMQQGAIAPCVGVTRVTFDRIHQNHDNEHEHSVGSERTMWGRSVFDCDDVKLVWWMGWAQVNRQQAGNFSYIVRVGLWGSSHWLQTTADCTWSVHSGGGTWLCPTDNMPSLVKSPYCSSTQLMDE